MHAVYADIERNVCLPASNISTVSLKSSLLKVIGISESGLVGWDYTFFTSNGIELLRKLSQGF
jgi:hypothetical protein